MSPVDAWIARTYGRHRTTQWSLSACVEPFPTTLSRDGASVVGIDSFRPLILKGNDSNQPTERLSSGVEPETRVEQRVLPNERKLPSIEGVEQPW